MNILKIFINKKKYLVEYGVDINKKKIIVILTPL